MDAEQIEQNGKQETQLSTIVSELMAIDREYMDKELECTKEEARNSMLMGMISNLSEDQLKAVIR